MSASPRQEVIEKVRSAVARQKMEALLKARETGEGPVFSEEQQANLSAFCKLKRVDPGEFLTAYTPYVIHGFPPQGNRPGTGGLCRESCNKLS